MFMQALLIVHLIILLALIGTILLQRSEGGGALGMGGGPSSMMSGRSAANFMTRATTILGVLFFATSISLTIVGNAGRKPTNSLMDDGTSKGGLPTKSIDLSVPKAVSNAVVPPAGDIPASSATAPAISLPADSNQPAPETKK